NETNFHSYPLTPAPLHALQRLRAHALQPSSRLAIHLAAQHTGQRRRRGGPGPGHLRAPATTRAAGTQRPTRLPAHGRPGPGDRSLAARRAATRLFRGPGPPAGSPGTVSANPRTDAGVARAHRAHA